MASGGHKLMTDPTRWILLKGNFRDDLHRGHKGYFFTIRCHPSVPALTRIEPTRLMPLLNPIGKLLRDQLLLLEAKHPEVKVETYAILPDHLHLCLWVAQRTPRTPLQLLTTFLLFSEKDAQQQFKIDTLWQRPGQLFACHSTKSYQQKKKYTLGNITRWHLEAEQKVNPHPHRLTHPKLDPAYAWEGYGAETLLNEEEVLPCYISHRTPDADVARFTRLAITLAQTGWTLVGGFVSPRERALLQAVRAVCNPTLIHLAATALKDQKLPAQLASALYRQTTLRLTSAEGAETCQRNLCVWQNLWAEHFCGDW